MTKNYNFVIFCIKLSFLIFTAHLKKKPPIEIDQIRFFFNPGFVFYLKNQDLALEKFFEFSTPSRAECTMYNQMNLEDCISLKMP